MVGKQRQHQTGKPLLSILVPVYNEEKTILTILKKVTSLPIDDYEVLVVNDASRDKSLELIKTFMASFKRPNVALRLFSHEANRGKGAGIKTALQHARGKYFVIQDADLEYDPADIPSILHHAVQNQCHVVYGSRFKGSIQNMPYPNYLANRFYNFLLRRLYRTAITDMHTCYKLIETDLLLTYNMGAEGFGYATELVSKTLKRGIAIHEVPISFNGRTKNEGKKIGFRDGIECILMILKYKFGRLHEEQISQDLLESEVNG